MTDVEVGLNMKVAFLDRDGTIISDYPDREWKGKKEPEFLAGSIQALEELMNLGYQMIIVTNQGMINDGIISDEQYRSLHGKMLQKLDENDVEILETFYCPHRIEENCNCKKPKPGMIQQALEKYPAIDLSESFLVGDSVGDIGLAQYFGLAAYGIGLSSKDIAYEKCKWVSSLAEVIEDLKKQ